MRISFLPPSGYRSMASTHVFIMIQTMTTRPKALLLAMA